MMWNNCPNQRAMQSGVWGHLRDFQDLHTVDAFVCTLPPRGCLQWLPFNKSLVIVEGTSLYAGYAPGCFETFSAIAREPRHSFGYNNQFQVALGDPTAGPLGEVRRWLPSFCGYNGEADGTAFDEEILDVLVFTKSGRLIVKELLRPVDVDELQSALDAAEAMRCSTGGEPCQRRRFRVRDLMDVLPEFQLSRLAAGGDIKAAVIVCTVFQVTYMSALELHRLNIPMFFPIPDAHFVGLHPDTMAADYFHLPSIGLFNHTADLAASIVTADPHSRHLRSKAFNDKFRDVLAEVWASRFRRMFPGLETGTMSRRRVPVELSLPEAWKRTVGVEWTPSEEEAPCEPPDKIKTTSPHRPPEELTT